MMDLRLGGGGSEGAANGRVYGSAYGLLAEVATCDCPSEVLSFVSLVPLVRSRETLHFTQERSAASLCRLLMDEDGGLLVVVDGGLARREAIACAHGVVVI